MIAEILNMTLALSLSIAFFASVLTIYAGFGGALFMVPLLAMLFDPVQAIALMAICNFVAYTHVMPSLLKFVTWREVVPIFLGLLISISIASSFLVSSNAELIRLFMGGFIISAAFLLLAKLRYKGPRGPFPSFFAGGMTGSIVGGFGVPAAPILVIYFLAADENTTVQRANVMFSVWLILTIMLLNLVAREAVETSTYYRSVFIAPASILGGLIGQYAFKKVPAAWFKRVANWLLVLVGVSLLLF